MPFSYVIAARDRLARVKGEGPIDLGACISAIETLATDPDFDPDYKALVDLRTIDFEPSNTDLQGIASFLGARCKSRQERTAVVVPQRMLGAGRIVTVLAEVAGFRMKMFTDWDAAQRWLGIPEKTDVSA